jgi:hypothetical protein
VATSVLTPLQLIAGSGLLQNQGIESSPSLAAAITAYKSTPLISAYYQAVGAGAAITDISANTVPAFSDSVPAAYSSLGNIMSVEITAQSTMDAGSGDVSKFVQALNLCQSYNSTTDVFINSAVNSQTYLATTFTSTNDSITGDITTVNIATTAFGQDLVNLGNLIDLSNLGNLGSPLALAQRIVQISGNFPTLSIYFLAVGVPQETVLNLTDPQTSVTDSVQKLMYRAMTQITGKDLVQILKLLKVTTANITTMADLLNPYKLFPNSYQSLTVTTANGPRAIYLNSSGAINTKLANDLPPYVVSSTGYIVNSGGSQ